MDPELDPASGADFIQANRRAAVTTAVTSLDSDPEAAARSMELSQATGVPAPVINGNLEGFEQQHKASLTTQLLNNNDYLRSYINANPMAAKVSNDDYAQLDAVSAKVSSMSLPQRIFRAPEALAETLFPGDPLKHFTEGGRLGSWIQQEDLKDHPIASAVVAGLGTPIELALRGLGGVLGTGIEAAEHAATAVGGESLGRDVGAMTEAELFGMSGRHGLHGPEADPAARIRPYIENGREPLPTILPEYDDFRAKQNAADVDALKEATNEAQASLTRERSPDLFRQFIAQHTDAEIGIGGNAVATLYGDKLPDPDDGLLGWVPGIEDKLKLARETGTDVSVPLADWLTHAEPETMQALHDDLRVRPGGITANEVKAAVEQKTDLGLVPANIGFDGNTYIGKRGNIHSDIDMKNAPRIDFDNQVKESGFVTPEGNYLTREQALDWANKNGEIIKPSKDNAGQLDANEYNEQRQIKPYREPDPLSEDVPSYRAATALEPLFSVGDRKLALERMEQKKDSHFTAENGFHDFFIHDENDNKIGALNISTQKGGKELYVDNITGINGLGPRDFGPALMRDLLRQLKAEFPNTESITGHRVSGAREKANSYMAPSASPVVKLDNPADWDTIDNRNEFSRILEGGQWETYSPHTKAYIKPYATRNLEDQHLVDVVNRELDKIVPNKVAVQEADRIVAGNAKGQTGAVEPTGIYIRYKETYPIILYSMEGIDPLGTARHEAIHHLRNYGFFKPEEWATLEKAADEQGWMDKYSIADRYPAGDRWLRLEESIADAYKDWEAGRFEDVTPETRTVFEKMKAFFDAIREHIAKLFGKDATWEDIFQKVSIGEIGGREGTEPLDARAFNEKLNVEEQPEGGSRVFERASTLGMTVDQFKAYDKLIAARHAEDIAAAEKRAADFQRKTQTKEWKDNRRELRADISREIHQRPDVAADLFFATGELYGQKIGSGYKLDSDQLSPEQRQAIPKDYQAHGGLNPDDVANIFGYGSGDAMLQRLAEYNAAKKASGLGAKDFVARVTDAEADRQMRLRYGVLEDNIVDSVKEQVASETQLDILHEETHKLGMEIGQAPLDKTAILTGLRDSFNKMQIGSLSSDAYMRAAGKSGRAVELALLKGDPQEAFRAKQQQYYATVIANLAIKTEKALGQFDKVAKRFSQRAIATVDQEYTNFIHDILMRVGKPVRRSVQDLETEISAGEYKSLSEFVAGKETHGLREVPVADILLDPSFRKKFEDLTVDEFNAINDSIKTLVTNGRDEKKIVKAGEAADLDEIKAQMIAQLKEFDERSYDAKGGQKLGPIPPSLAHVIRTYGINHIQTESLLNRWDHGDPKGVFTQYVMRDLVTSANNEAAMEKRFAGLLREVDDKADLSKGVDNNLFKVPGTEQFFKMTRANLRAVLMDMGNESNMSKRARGYGIKPEQLWTWINQHATKEDWDWAQKMGDVFKPLKEEGDIMYRNLSGVAPASLELKPVQTLHGEYPGWYYPVIMHPEFEGASKKLMGKDALEQEGFVRATPSSGYTKGRTGYAGPMAMDLDMLPARMKQMIHDVAMRPAIINASKIFYDKDVRQAVHTNFGAEWRDSLVPYLVDVANSANYIPKNQRAMVQASEFIRQNMISTLVGFNPGTVIKHFSTAGVQSMMEVEPARFLKAIKGLTSINERTGESNWSFAMRESQELQRRDRNYEETLGGTLNTMMPSSKFMTFRQTIQKYASKPVAISDLVSAVPTWLAQYEKSIEEGGSHGDAVFMADRAVRRAHGSTAITNRSQVMRGGAMSQWMASVYGFFNHVMNRQYELMWRAGETIDMVKNKEGSYEDAMKQGAQHTAMLFAYVLAPALIEEMVTPLVSSDNESWGKKAAKGVAFTLAASWVGVRDIASAMLNGRDPSVGLFSTAYKTISDIGRDLSKNQPLSKEHAGKIVKDGATLMGTLTGVVPAQIGKTAEFAQGVHAGTERPKGPWGWMVGARFGTLKNHAGTFQEWQRHH